MERLFYISSAGCAENLIDGSILKTMALKAGCAQTDDPARADIIVYNTCAFKKIQEDACMEAIARFARVKKPDAVLVVCGCLARINPERLRTVFDGPVFGPTELGRFFEVLKCEPYNHLEDIYSIPPELFRTQMFGRRILDRIMAVKKTLGRRTGLRFFPNFDILDFLGDPDTLFIRIARGCNNKCAYCSVRFAQGPLVSVRPDKIIETARRGLAAGQKQIMLTATNIMEYGSDIGADFPALLERILALGDGFRIIIQNLEPFGFNRDSGRLTGLLSDRRILSLYCPINSGSQKVLNAMRRRYDIDTVMKTLREIREKNPRAKIRTEFIAGHPGEGWREFMETLRLIIGFRFDLIDLHYFSPRPGTDSPNMPGQVSEPVKRLRWAILHAVVFLRVMLPKTRPL